MKTMNMTCHVDRLRESSGVYPRPSRLASAESSSISAIVAWGFSNRRCRAGSWGVCRDGKLLRRAD